MEQQILADLKLMGFPDDTECMAAIERVKQNPDATLTADVAMMDIITQREEAEEARKMDQARLASEQDRRDEPQRLRDLRKQDDKEKVLRATFDALKNPSSAEDKKLMFGSSWLLRYEECSTVLKDIANNATHRDAKRALIPFLNQEKDANRWFSADDLPKSWFTCVAGKRMLDAFANGGYSALKLSLIHI